VQLRGKRERARKRERKGAREREGRDSSQVGEKERTILTSGTIPEICPYARRGFDRNFSS
jgi:hypothetical protein